MIVKKTEQIYLLNVINAREFLFFSFYREGEATPTEYTENTTNINCHNKRHKISPSFIQSILSFFYRTVIRPILVIYIK